MKTPLNSEQIERMAHRRTSAKLGWYFHAFLYVLINLIVFATSEYGFGSRPWSLFPLLGWGLGVALHGISVFVLGANGSLRERMVQKECERLRRERGDGMPR